MHRQAEPSLTLRVTIEKGVKLLTSKHPISDAATGIRRSSKRCIHAVCSAKKDPA
mgnify:CR=1 FL=1